MHEARLGMQYRHKRVQGLQEREPALITLPFDLPEIPVLSVILDPLITPILAGPATTTSTTIQTTDTPTTSPTAPDPTSTQTPAQTPAPSPTSANGSSGTPSSGSSSANGSDPASSASAPSSPSPSGSSEANPSSDSSNGSPDGSSAQNSGGAPSTSVVVNAEGGQAFVTSGASSTDSSTETGAVETDANGNTITASASSPVATGRLTETGTSLYFGSQIGSNTSTSTSRPTGSVDAASGSHGLSTGIIVAISVIAVLLGLILLLCCIRRRAIVTRVRRRKEWYAEGAYQEKDYTDKDAAPALAGSRSARSSFATTFDRGQVLTPAPAFDIPTFDVPVSVEQVSKVWPSELDGSVKIVTVPAASHSVASVASPTIRSAPDRSSIHSNSSAGGNRPGSQNSQYLVAVPPAAATEGSPYNRDFPSPFSVRPFSPSESFAFPKPPKDDANSRAASEMLSGSIKSSMHGSAFFTAEDMHSAENENPFADFTEIPARPHSASTENSVPHHFAPVEPIRRPFVPSMNDEMAVNLGDEVRILKRFDDGWAVAEKIGANMQGLIPIDCLRPVEEELPAFLAKKRISSYRARSSIVPRASVTSGTSNIGAAL